MRITRTPIPAEDFGVEPFIKKDGVLYSLRLISEENKFSRTGKIYTTTLTYEIENEVPNSGS